MTPENYIQKIASRLNKQLGKPLDEQLGRFYALLVLTTGVNTTLRNVHDAWAAWRDATRPDHQSLIPFEELTPGVQELDQPYADAIVAVAKELGRG